MSDKSDTSNVLVAGREMLSWHWLAYYLFGGIIYQAVMHSTINPLYFSVWLHVIFWLPIVLVDIVIHFLWWMALIAVLIVWVLRMIFPKEMGAFLNYVWSGFKQKIGWV